MLSLIVEFTVQSGREEEAKRYMRSMEENSRRETGCRYYIGHQSTEDPRRFAFYEQYDDQAALEAHQKTPYFKEFVRNGLQKIWELEPIKFFNTI